MTHNWDDSDEAWDENDDYVDEDAAPCPECGRPVEAIADKCSACGYWLSNADRGAMWSSELKPLWLRVTAVIVLAAFLVSLLAIGITLF